MRDLSTIVLALALLGAPAFAGDPATEIDRLLAAVNGQVITAGDLTMARNLNALVLLGKAAASRSRSEELEGLVDLELLRQELENFPMAPVDPESIEAEMDELRRAYAEIGGLRTLLLRLGLQESELQSYVRFRASILSFVRYRFRPFVHVEPEEADAYYETVLLPQLRQTGARIPPFEEVSDSISELLTEQMVNAALDRWIEEIRRHSKIEYFSGEENADGEIR